MTYTRIYLVNAKDQTRFIREVDANSKIAQHYRARAEKTALSNKQKDTECVFVREGKAR